MLLLEGIVLGAAIGLVLGTIGAGGAILAVPGLIAVMGLSTVAATTSALVIVGTAAVAGVVPRLKAKNVNIRLGLTFSALGVAGTFIGTQLVDLISEPAQLILFASLMFGSALAMWRGPVSSSVLAKKGHWYRVIAVATGIGILTGLLGVGGGFLIVPALVVILKVPTKVAAGTSLVAIASNATIAFFMRYQYWDLIPLTSIFAFSLSAVTASFLSAPLAARLDPKILQRSFAILVAFIALILLVI